MEDVAGITGQRLRIVYVRVKDAVQWERNPKKHDLEGVKASIRKYGFRDAPIWDATLEAIPAGNGRTTALFEMESDGKDEPPLGVAVTAEGDWCMPLQVGIDAASVELAEAFGLDHNNLTLGGSGLSAYETSLLWDDDYPRLLAELQAKRQLPVSVTDDDLLAITRAMLPPTPQQVDDEAGEGDEDDEAFWSMFRAKIPTDSMEKFTRIKDLLKTDNTSIALQRTIDVALEALGGVDVALEPPTDDLTDD
jgi:hypothetical protein